MAKTSVQKQIIISILSVLLYSIGFFRIEVELRNHKRKIIALENAAQGSEKSNRNNFPEGKTTNSVRTSKFSFINCVLYVINPR